MFLSETVKIVKVADHSASAGTEVDSTGVDTAGYAGCLFVTSLSVANAGNYLSVQQSSDNGVADAFDDLTGSKVLSGTSDEDLWADVQAPGKRYVRVAVIRAGTNTTCESIWAILYGPNVEPVSNLLTGTIAGEAHFAPVEGTA
jgi:hypothetical protein